MIFRNQQHEEDYKALLSKSRNPDTYRQAYFYLLALVPDLSQRSDKLYDFEKEQLTDYALDINHAWHTSSSLRALRLGLNLYTDRPATNVELTGEDKVDETAQYSASDIFYDMNAPYFWEAIQLRYPDHTNLEATQKMERMIEKARKEQRTKNFTIV